MWLCEGMQYVNLLKHLFDKIKAQYAAEVEGGDDVVFFIVF